MKTVIIATRPRGNTMLSLPGRYLPSHVARSTGTHNAAQTPATQAIPEPIWSKKRPAIMAEIAKALVNGERLSRLD
jgi:hypothetical protein